jgi:autotransporter-associated beta strand protein
MITRLSQANRSLRSCRFTLSACLPAFFFILVCTSAHGTNVYWDINGNSPGATNTTVATGQWDNSTTLWTTNSGGTSATTTYATAAGGTPSITNPDVFFSAGTNATGAFTVSLKSDSEMARSITIEEGNVTIDSSSGNGATLTIGAGGITIDSGAGLTISSSVAGKLILADGAAQNWTNNSSNLFSVTLPVAIGANLLTITGPGDTSISGVISGTGGLTKSGASTLTLSGANTYTGATTVNAGKLFVNGSLAAGSAVTVSGSGTTLGGTGTINGSVSIGSGSKLQGGTGSTGQTLTLTGAVTMSNGSIFQLALDGSGTHSTIAINGGSLAFAPTASQQHFNFIGTPVVGTYLGIITGVPNPTTTVMNQWVIDNAGYSGSFTWDSTNGGEIDLTLTAVPEPGTWCAAALAFGAVLITQRRRLKKLPARS